MTSTHISSTRASLAVVCSAVLWGTWWIPIRQVSVDEFGGSGAILVGLLLPLFVLLPWGVWRIRRLVAGGWPIILGAIFVAASMALYAEGMLRGQVARVILLFYLTPIWSTLLGRLMLNETITRNRIVAVALGLAGMVVIVGFENGIPLPHNLYEWMALVAGASWGLGMVYVRRTAHIPVVDRLVPQLIALFLIFFLVSLIPGGAELAVPSALSLKKATLWLLLFAFVWTLPVFFLAIYGGSGVNPGRVAILLLLEPVIGIVSAAILTDEPFGRRELIGAILIISAGLVEVLPLKSRTRG